MCSPRAFFCFCHAAHQVSPLFDAPAPNPAPNTPRTPTNRNTMLATSTTIKWPFPLNSLKRGTKSSVTSGTTSLGIPKYQVQQTRLLHLAKGRKVSRKVICDAVETHYATTTGITEAAAEWVKNVDDAENPLRMSDGQEERAMNETMSQMEHSRLQSQPYRCGTHALVEGLYRDARAEYARLILGG